MNKIQSILLAALVALTPAMLPAQTAPAAVRKASSSNRLMVKPQFDGTTKVGKGVFKAPQSRFITVAEATDEAVLPVTIIGGMIDSESWTETIKPYGLYKLPAKASEPFEYIRSDIYPNGGGVESDGVYYATEVSESGDGVSIIIRAYDTETWRNTRSFSPDDYSMIATDVAKDPLSGQIYGCLWDESGSGYMFGTIDYVDGRTHKIKALTNMWHAIAIDADGTIYAIDQEMVIEGSTVRCAKSSLYTVDRETGDMTLVGDTGQLPRYAGSAVIDLRSGRMFWSVCPEDDDNSALYEVNKQTGAATLVYKYPSAEQFMGFYIPAPLAEDGAPAAVTDLKADFERGSLDGTVSFKVPATTFDGKPASGAVDYDIYANGAHIKLGTTAYGRTEIVPVSLPTGGECEFIVSLSNAVGVSPKEKVKVFAGTDVPQPPVVKAAWNEGTMTVTWTAPTESVNGGYVDSSAMTYKVTRYPDEIVVSDGKPGTSFTEAVAEPSDVVSYYYTVSATYDGKRSAPGVSNKVVLGAAQAPYSVNIANEGNLDKFTVINVEPDSKAWTYSSGTALLGEDKMLEKDDWLITQPVKLVPGNVYSVTVLASSQGTLYPENIEIFCGETNTVEAMTEAIVEKTTVSTSSSSDWQTITGYIATDKPRTIYVGIHACSPADVYNLRVSSVAIEPAFATTAPGAVEDFSVVPDAAGALSVQISMKAPSVDYDGKTISELDSVVIYRDGVQIHKKEAPAPGADVNYTDTEATTGQHVYSAIAFNANGRGRETKTKVFVGINTPVAPADAVLTETDDAGEVTVSWTPVTTDVDGYPLSSDLITYTIYEPNQNSTAWVPKYEGLKGTSYTFRAIEEGQMFGLYAVAAVTAGGTSQARVAEYIPVGVPYQLPYSETFANGEVTTLFTYTSLGGDWVVTPNNPEYLAQAEDNGYAVMMGEYYGMAASFISGKISLKGAVNPVLSYRTFNYYTDETGPDYNTIDVYVREAGGKWALEKSTIVKDVAEHNRWGGVSVNLGKYVGKTVQLMFTATGYSYDQTALDQIKVANGVDYNLSVTGIKAPERVNANENFDVVVKIDNSGLNDAADFVVELYRDNALAESRHFDALLAGRDIDISFSQVFTPMVEDDVEYQAVVVYGRDMVADDNKSAKVTVSPEPNALPVVTGLDGKLNGTVVELTWNEPDTDSALPEPKVESFEEAEPYAVTGVCGWTFVDADGVATQDHMVTLGTNDIYGGGVNNYAPGIGDGSPLAWGVLDFYSGFASHYTMFQAHGGSKSLVALASSGKANDDWAISPELFASEQTISFWAKTSKNGAEWGTESIEILYSTTDKELTSFTSVKVEKFYSEDWKQFFCQLPEGAKYFALRYVSDDCYRVMVDDISFIPADATADISIMGYNVYRNGVKINDEPVEDTMFHDTVAPGGSNSYVVTAVYDKGESHGSNEVSVECSGIVDEYVSGVAIKAVDKTITVSGAEGSLVAVVSVDGKVLDKAVAGSVYTFTAELPGVYIVKAADKTAKVVIR